MKELNSMYKNNPTFESPKQHGKMKVNVHALTLRKKPYQGAPIAPNGIFMEGVVVDVLGKVNDEWVKVKTESGEGYMMLEYLVEV